MKTNGEFTAGVCMAALMGMASSVFAATGGESEGSGVLIFAFLAFGALILVFQLIPGLLLFFSMVKGLFASGAAKKAVTVEGKK